MEFFDVLDQVVALLRVKWGQTLFYYILCPAAKVPRPFPLRINPIRAPIF